MVLIAAREYELAIQRALEFLERSQLPSGEFKTLVATDPDIRLGAKHDPSIFSSVNVATSLLEVPAAGAGRLIDKAAAFLQSEMLAGGLWRFWTKTHPGSAGMPPDVDDTVCVSDLLRRISREVPDNRRMLLSNRAPNGLFYTWIIPRPRHLFFPEGRKFLAAAMSHRKARAVYFRSGPQPPIRDGVDCVVNCNALLYLGDGIATAAASEWVMQVLQNGSSSEADRWYQSEAALIYSAARCIERGVRSLRVAAGLIGEKACRPDTNSLSVLEAGLLTCALAIVNPSSARLPALARSVLESQKSDGGWGAHVYYYDSPLRALSWGARELTTGFCVEALTRFLRSCGK